MLDMFIGGVCSTGEDASETLVRELREEVNVNLGNLGSASRHERRKEEERMADSNLDSNSNSDFQVFMDMMPTARTDKFERELINAGLDSSLNAYKSTKLEIFQAIEKKNGMVNT